MGGNDFGVRAVHRNDCRDYPGSKKMNRVEEGGLREVLQEFIDITECFCIDLAEGEKCTTCKAKEALATPDTGEQGA